MNPQFEARLRRAIIQAALDNAIGELEHIDRLISIVSSKRSKRRLMNRRYIVELKRDECEAARRSIPSQP